MEKLEIVTALLDRLAENISAFDPGDVMKAADSADLTEKLCGECAGDVYAEQICLRLKEIAHEVLSDCFADFPELFTDGMELLRQTVKNGGQSGAVKPDRITAWLAERTEDEKKKNEAESVRRKIPETLPSDGEDKPQQIDSGQLQQFVSDCEDRLASAQDLILRIESEPDDGAAVKELFRIFHTIKGECGFLKLARLGKLAHNVENLLDELRSGKRKADREVTDILLEGLDLAGRLTEALKHADFSAYTAAEVGKFADRTARFIENGQTEQGENTGMVAQQENADRQAVQRNGSADTVIKVKTGKINYLTDMIGELLICLGQMKEDTNGLSQVKKIARSLQYAGMQLRTESVHTLFGTVRRIIRDTSQKVGKEVSTVFEGEDLEIDRTLIESLEEPLMHLVRNALDHGIESTEDRIHSGKTPRGTIRVTAERRGNSIVISVADDGRGLDREKILRKAVEKKLIREQDISGMSETAVNNLIFVSGFSTNDTVDQISGRGVGMDIVKNAVAEAKGHIVTESISGKGTSFSLYFPLSTAIIDGMLTRTGENIFIIPVTSIVESLKVKKEQLYKVAGNIDVLNLRGKIFPVIRMAEVFKIAEARSGEIATVVEDSSGGQYAFMNDELIAKREVVIKNLGPYFSRMEGISSGTVLAGGAIGYVLDVDQVVALGKFRNGAL
jgi:two-component system chemotaxis sensor kinase CheA